MVFAGVPLGGYVVAGHDELSDFLKKKGKEGCWVGSGEGGVSEDA